METKWSITRLLASASLGVLLLVLHLGGAAINAATGNVAIGGGINSLLTSTLVVVCSLIIGRFGSVTLMLFTYGVLALPFNLIGPPGLVIKIPIAIVGGLIVDSLFYFLRGHRFVASLVIAGPLQLYLGWILVAAATLFHFPGFETVAANATIPLIVGSFAVGAIGGYFGWLIYSRLKDSAVVIRIQGDL